jgi:RNA polymerase subunit RPABC4/transcription elongation factor Spt4
MNPCRNCGKVNSPATNFCRFCGTKFLVQQPVPDNPYDYSAPRPYAWKTDEFQAQPEPRNTAHIGHSQPDTSYIGNRSAVQPPAAPLEYRRPQQFGQPFRCPKCMGSYVPRMERRISTAGWITFAVLLVFFFPLFWIGLLIKEDVRVCPACDTKIG